VGDTVSLRDADGGSRRGRIVRRSLVQDKERTRVAIVVRLDTGEEWETGFDL